MVPELSNAICSRDYKGARPKADQGAPLVIAHALRAAGFDASEDGTGRGTPLVTTLAIRGRGGEATLETRDDGTANAILTPNGGRGGIGVGAIAFTSKDHGADAGEVSPTLRGMGHDQSHANGGGQVAVAMAFGDVADPIVAGGSKGAGNNDGKKGRPQNVMVQGMAVRRLTPRECERLMGFPDDYTLVTYRKKPAADGPRYKALGNSMAINVVRWIGQRIQAVENITNGKNARRSA